MRTIATLLIATVAVTSAMAASSPSAAATTTVTTWLEPDGLDAVADNCNDGDVIELGADITAPANERLDFGCTSITLDLSGNSLTITAATDEAGVAVPAGTSLTIIDTGTDPTLGALSATGGQDAAGIGGDSGVDAGSVTIEGGAVTGNGGGGAAGIGGGESSAGGNVVINGGIVTGNGGGGGAGIGGGGIGGASSGGDGGTTTINGGTVVCDGGGGGAGVGGGSSGGHGGVITINGGDVACDGGGGAAGIGGGGSGGGGTITINGGMVTTEGGGGGTGIGSGSGFEGTGGTITINGGTITANGGGDGAGIGSGFEGTGGTVIINGGTIDATGGPDGAGIGGGVDAEGGTVVITGGTVTARGTDNAAGIGGSDVGGDGASVTISGGVVTASGLYAGVGGAPGGPPGLLTLVGTPLPASTASTGSAGTGVAPDITTLPGPRFYTATDTPPGVFFVEYSRKIERRAGATRIATAIDTSLQRFGSDEAGAVVLARADVFPDALVGGPLAALTDAPLLLTTSEQLPPEVLAEIDRVLEPGSTVYVLGGTAAISPTVTAALTAAGYTPVRYGGATRYDTATEVADAVVALSDDDTTALVATGTEFPDALTASAAGADAGWPVLLTNDDAPSPATDTWLTASAAEMLVCVGGPACRAYPGSDTQLIGGDRYTTAIAVAEEFFTPGTDVGLASGEVFPDALVGAADTPDRGGPLVLTRTDTLPPAVDAFITTWDPAEIRVYGGTAAITDDVLDVLG